MISHRLVRPHIRRTPVIEVDGGDLGLAVPVCLVLKLELLQHAGSFKPRGAFANLLARTVPPAGVVAASGGNHGAAVAFAAQRRGVPATVFVPSAPSWKRRRPRPIRSSSPSAAVVSSVGSRRGTPARWDAGRASSAWSPAVATQQLSTSPARFQRSRPPKPRGSSRGTWSGIGRTDGRRGA